MKIVSKLHVPIFGYSSRNKPSKSVTVGPGRAGSILKWSTKIISIFFPIFFNYLNYIQIYTMYANILHALIKDKDIKSLFSLYVQLYVYISTHKFDW